MEPGFNEPVFNEVLDITNDILCPGQSYSKMYGIEPRYNEPRYNEFFDITNLIRKPKRKIYLAITNYNVNMRQKINAEQINSQQILVILISRYVLRLGFRIMFVISKNSLYRGSLYRGSIPYILL